MGGYARKGGAKSAKQACLRMRAQTVGGWVRFFAFLRWSVCLRHVWGVTWRGASRNHVIQRNFAPQAQKKPAGVPADLGF